MTTTIWYTRCPVPTASGIAFQRGLFAETFAGTPYAVRNIKELGRERANTHFDHSLDFSFREGGGSPPMWARARGADTCLLGLTFMDEAMGIYVRADDPARSVADLAGRRCALPVWPGLVFNFLRFAAQKGFYSALKIHGLSERDVVFVDTVNDQDMHAVINSDFAEGKGPRPARSYYDGELQALLRGAADAIFLRGAEVAQVEREAQGRIRCLYDLRDAPTLADRVNNSSPRLLTVSGALVRQHPEAVIRYVQALVRAACWAHAHPVEAWTPIAAECGVQPDDIGRYYRPGFTARLLPAVTPALLAAADVMKTFLYDRGYLSDDFSLASWLNPEPLQEAYRREGVAAAQVAQAA